MIRLTSSKNQIIKEVRALKNKSEREEKGLYFIEGIRFVSEALKEQIDIRYFVVSETFSSDKENDLLLSSISNFPAQCYVVPDKLYNSISDTKTPQGVLAVIKLIRNQLKGARLPEGLLVILDSIKDPGNLGTIIRTADAAGCAGVIVPEGCVDVYNPKVLRSTMGSLFHVPVYFTQSITYALNTAKEQGFLLCASHLEGSVSIYETDLSKNVALIIGSEAHGISEESRKKADVLIRIPMQGRAESLNASIAAGVIIFEAMRQRLYKGLGRGFITDNGA
jgi:TrmH family RNA methyltransferase